MALAKLADLAHRITFLTGDINYTFVHLIDAPQMLMCKTLKASSESLQHFIRVHKKYTINPAYLEKVLVEEPHRVSLVIRGQTIPISRRRQKEVLALLGQTGAFSKTCLSSVSLALIGTTFEGT